MSREIPPNIMGLNGRYIDTEDDLPFEFAETEEHDPRREEYDPEKNQTDWFDEAALLVKVQAASLLEGG